MVTEEEVVRLVCVARQTRILWRTEGIVLVETYAKMLVQIGPVLELDSMKARTIASSIIDPFLNIPFNVIDLDKTNSSLSRAK